MGHRLKSPGNHPIERRNTTNTYRKGHTMDSKTQDIITHVMTKNRLTPDSPVADLWDAFYDQWQDDHNNHNDDNANAAQWADRMTTQVRLLTSWADRAK